MHTNTNTICTHIKKNSCTYIQNTHIFRPKEIFNRKSFIKKNKIFDVNIFPPKTKFDDTKKYKTHTHLHTQTHISKQIHKLIL